jgi:hypothetical protein
MSRFIYRYMLKERYALQIYGPIAAILASVLVHMIASRNLEYTRKFFDAFVATPVKLMAFLLLGKVSLHYFGYLNHFPTMNVIAVAGFGGLGLSIVYLLERFFLPMSESDGFTIAGARPDGGQRKEIKLDWALQEEITRQFVCEIYHTVAGVVMGVSVMRLADISAIDHRHLDLLMTAGLLGPTLSFVVVISLALIVFGAMWCLHRCFNWFYSRTVL